MLGRDVTLYTSVVCRTHPDIVIAGHRSVYLMSETFPRWEIRLVLKTEWGAMPPGSMTMHAGTDETAWDVPRAVGTVE